MTEQNPLPTPEPEEAATGVTVRLTNESNTGAAQTPANGWTEVSQDWQQVGEEFKKLGLRLSGAIRDSWKTTSQDPSFDNLGAQLRAMAEQVETAVKTARQEAASPEVKAQIQRAVAAAKEAQASLVDEIRDAVAAGLRTLNTQLKDLAERLETGRNK